MANYEPSDLIEEGSNAIPNGQLAPVMRRSMENKNLLAEKGSIYVGTGGTYETQDDTGDNVFNTAVTQSLSPGSSGMVLMSDASNANNAVGLRWGWHGYVVTLGSWETSQRVGFNFQYPIPASNYGNLETANLLVQVMSGKVSEGFAVEGVTVIIYPRSSVERNDARVMLYSNTTFAGRVLILPVNGL